MDRSEPRSRILLRVAEGGGEPSKFWRPCRGNIDDEDCGDKGEKATASVVSEPPAPAATASEALSNFL